MGYVRVKSLLGPCHEFAVRRGQEREITRHRDVSRMPPTAATLKGRTVTREAYRMVPERSTLARGARWAMMRLNVRENYPRKDVCIDDQLCSGGRLTVAPFGALYTLWSGPGGGWAQRVGDPAYYHLFRTRHPPH